MNVAEINPLSLPSLPLSERKHLPSCPAIYFVMQGDHILYIGQTTNLAQRWATHNRLKQFAKMVGDIRVAWLECSDTTLLRKVEAALIEQFEPELNGGSLAGICPPRTAVYLNEEMQKALERWAGEENRSVSNLAATILMKAIKEHQQENPSASTSEEDS